MLKNVLGAHVDQTDNISPKKWKKYFEKLLNEKENLISLGSTIAEHHSHTHLLTYYLLILFAYLLIAYLFRPRWFVSSNVGFYFWEFGVYDQHFEKSLWSTPTKKVVVNKMMCIWCNLVFTVLVVTWFNTKLLMAGVVSYCFLSVNVFWVSIYKSKNNNYYWGYMGVLRGLMLFSKI